MLSQFHPQDVAFSIHVGAARRRLTENLGAKCHGLPIIDDKLALWWWTSNSSLIARFMGPTWGPAGASRTQVGPMWATWTLPSEYIWSHYLHVGHRGNHLTTYRTINWLDVICRPHFMESVANGISGRNILHDMLFVCRQTEWCSYWIIRSYTTHNNKLAQIHFLLTESMFFCSIFYCIILGTISTEFCDLFAI